MIKIGFIDYYLDEWHANNYPEMLRELSDGECQVICAFGLIDPPAELGEKLTNRQWAEKYGIELLPTIEEVVEKSDCLVVLSPDNPEMHEELARIPLESGKLTYIDKTFAPDKATAQRIFDVAHAHNTPCFSTSSLRFCTELDGVDTDSICKIYSEGPGTLEVYAVHMIEPIVRLMKCAPRRVMALDGNKRHPSYLVEFEDGRLAQIHHRRFRGSPYRLTLMDKDNRATFVNLESDYFRLFIAALVEFFRTGVAPVPHEDTVGVMAAIDAAVRGCETPYRWIEL